MLTSFTALQLRDPAIADADRVLRTCVHYGFCTGTCPTYVLTRDENESPRGRIDLIRAMLERGGPPDDATVRHLDSCLSCLACRTTCAAKVDYARLIDIARAYVETNHRRAWTERMLRGLIARTLPYPRRLRAALAAGRLVGPLSRWMPGRLAGLAALAGGARASARGPAPGVYPADGERRCRVLLLAGCVSSVLGADIHAATLRLLRRHGCDVVVASEAGCCGALPLHMGRESQARRLAQANLAAWARFVGPKARDPVDAIVVDASGCGTTLKDYRRWPGGPVAEAVGALARDVTEVLDELGVRPTGNAPRLRVAYHDACSLQHGQRVIDPPRRLLAAAGFEVHEVPERHFCCGSAGTYHLLQPDTASTLGRRKADHADSVDADAIAAGNLGCLVQIGRYASTPVLHTIELVDWATGGPMPGALAGRMLRQRTAPEAARADAAATSATSTSTGTAPPGANDLGVW
ncbi:MAG: glycolate oxidase subunit GlcF [Burkholderiales bacterium]